jgi:hypothetical protein
MKKQIFGLLAMAAAIGSVGATVPSKSNTAPVINNANKKPVAQINNFVRSESANPYKHIRTPKKNQRQKRKYLRQNPNMRN